MPQLTADYSEALAMLIHSNDAPIDGIEVGPWFTPEKIKHLQQKFHDWQFQFHASSFLTRYRHWRGALQRLNEYLRCTQSQWVSLHIELLPVLTYVMGSHFGLQLPAPNVEQAKNGFFRVLSDVKDSMELPVILENLSSLPQEKYAYAANPSVINDIVRSSDSGFLLDIAHARLAASYRRTSIENYLEELPLDCITQIHISGVRKKNGSFQDAHEVLEDEDYSILKWALERSKPKVVTLEYFREMGMLRTQLWRLQEIVASQ